MTYEQGGIGAGRSILMTNGNYLTLKDRIAHHLTTGLSTVEIASKNATRLVMNFEEFYRKSSLTPPGMFKTYVVKSTNGKGKIKAFCELLDRHKIQYGHVKSGMAKTTAYNYTTGKDNDPLSISAEDVVVSAYQPLAILTQILLDPEPEIVDSATYDITAWSLPHAFGLETYASKDRIEVTPEPLAKTFALKIKPEGKPYAYVATWNGLNNARFAAHLLQKGVKIRTASQPFDIEGKKFARGTMIITRGDNPSVGERFDREITAAALLNEQELTAVATGFSDKGADLGSSRFDLMTKPSVALIYDDDVDNNSYGQMWCFFEQDLNIASTQVKLTDLARLKLATFNIICMTDGGYSNLDSGKLERLKQWCTEGGRLILIGEALAAFEDKKGFELTKYASKKEREVAEDRENETTLKHRFMHFDDYERDAISDGIPGAIYKVSLDNTHPLAYGMNDHYFTLKTSGTAYQPIKNAWNVGILDDKFKPLGFVGSRLKPLLKSTAVFAVQGMRRGSVVYLVDNPLYRNFWYQGKFLFSNAVLMPIR